MFTESSDLKKCLNCFYLLARQSLYLKSQKVGESVAEWLRSLISNHLPLIAVGSNPDMDVGFLHVRKLSMQQAYGTSVVLYSGALLYLN
jgi:hypothetical protein